MLQELKSLVRSNKYFFLSYLLFLVAGGFGLIIVPKGTFLLWFNSHHTPFLDEIFKTATFLGDGWFVMILLVPVFLVKAGYSFYMFLSYSLSGIFAQILKRIFDTPRPKSFFGLSQVLYYVPGVEIYSFHSFPSGHTATAFAYCVLISIITKNKLFGIFYFLIALVIGLSRVYLAQHFFIDIYFGSLIGVIITLFSYLIFNHILKTNSKNWYNFSLILKFKK